MRTRRSGCAYGSGRSIAALMALKIAAVAPMPTPTVATIVSVSIGTRSRLRMPMRKSWHEILNR